MVEVGMTTSAFPSVVGTTTDEAGTAEDREAGRTALNSSVMLTAVAIWAWAVTAWLTSPPSPVGPGSACWLGREWGWHRRAMVGVREAANASAVRYRIVRVPKEGWRGTKEYQYMQVSSYQ
jgi:hypothetical protein